MKTRWFGNDCIGNTPHALTVEGVCIQDIYAPEGRRFYNQDTRQHGSVARGEDGELHFFAAAEDRRRPCS